jgi:hypothetical protein
VAELLDRSQPQRWGPQMRTVNGRAARREKGKFGLPAKDNATLNFELELKSPKF